MNDNDALVLNILQRTFFNAWKKENLNNPVYLNHRSLEMRIIGACDLACTYCYYTNYGKELYPPEISKGSTIIKNISMLINWLEENKYYPKIDIFSGEIFATPVGFEACDLILDWMLRYADNFKKEIIVIPTNFSFVTNDKRMQRVDDFLVRARNGGIDMRLSASIDGKFMDSDNRPFKSGFVRDDNFYDRAFQFSKRWGAAFHPMVYSNNIENWIPNFDWFQSMFEKYCLPWSSIYLLEVRNSEWTSKQVRDYYKFIRYITNFCFKKSGVPPHEFIQYAFTRKLMNAFSMFFKVGRGTGCSVQSTLQLRMGDLCHTICHRASYKPHELWNFTTDGEKITGVKATNPGLFIAWNTIDEDQLPYCELCAIKYLCNGQCWGSMYETNRSLFVPTPTVCLVEHAKIAAVIDELTDLGIIQYTLPFCDQKISSNVSLYLNRFNQLRRK